MLELDAIDADSWYELFVYVRPRANCPHGGGVTYPVLNGVRIVCPEDRECWLVKWEFEDARKD